MEKKLELAVIDQLGGYEEINEDCLQTLQDVTRGGANAGFERLKQIKLRREYETEIQNRY